MRIPVVATVSLAAGLLLPATARAQYWVEFNPGTCRVGPPPACVAGHWHPASIPPRLPTASATRPGATPARKKFSEVTTDVEYESFSVRGDGTGQGGSSVGARGMYARSGANGTSGGVVLGAQRATFDGSDADATLFLVGQAFLSSDLSRRMFGGDAALVNSLTASVGVSGSRIQPGGDGELPGMTTYGPFATATYARRAGAMTYGATLSYSVARLAGTGLEGATQTAGSWALGLNGAYAITPTLQFSADAYNLKGGPTVVAGSLTRLFTETFGLTAGANTLLGMNGFSSRKLTLGTTFRAY